MKQRTLLLFFVYLLFASSLIAQEAITHTFQQKGATFTYAQYGELDSARNNLIIALADTTDGACKPAAWAQELSWFADQVNACVVAPDLEFGTYTKELLEQFIVKTFPQVDSSQVRFIALGSGARHVCNLLALGYSGLLISPFKGCMLEGKEQENVVGIVSTRETDSVVIWKDSLQRTGRWVKEVALISEAPYYFDRKEEVLLDLWKRVDEQLSNIQDSTWRSTYQSTLLGEVPEVVREGKYIELQLQLAEQGDVEIDLLDLSARPVHQTHVFLGKGQHSFHIPTKGLKWGVYKLEVDGPGMIEKHRIMIRG